MEAQSSCTEYQDQKCSFSHHVEVTSNQKSHSYHSFVFLDYYVTSRVLSDATENGILIKWMNQERILHNIYFSSSNELFETSIRNEWDPSLSDNLSEINVEDWPKIK